MYIYIYICVCVHIYPHTHIYIYIYTCVCVCVYTYIYMCVRACVCIYCCILFSLALFPVFVSASSYTFQIVQDKTNDYWNYHRFQLVVEYHSRPPLPPPFIIFTHLWLLMRYVLCRCCCDLHRKSSDLCELSPLLEFFNKKVLNMLQLLNLLINRSF